MRRNHGDERQVEGVECARRLPQRGGGSDGDETWKNRVRLNYDAICIQLDRIYIALAALVNEWYIPRSHFLVQYRSNIFKSSVGNLKRKGDDVDEIVRR